MIMRTADRGRSTIRNKLTGCYAECSLWNILEL